MSWKLMFLSYGFNRKVEMYSITRWFDAGYGSGAPDDVEIRGPSDCIWIVPNTEESYQ